MTADLATGTAEPPVAGHDVALLDLDGVVYVGMGAVGGAVEAIAAARSHGMQVAFVTNNASRTPDAVASRLRDLGVAADASDVVTSAQAAARLLREHAPVGARVLAVGGPGVAAALRDQEFRVVETADDADAVVQGFGPDVGWRQLAEATYAVRRGVPWIAANLDATVPTARGVAPGNGALVGVVAAAARTQPLAVAGKPELALHRESILRTGARTPLVVGDRLDTDIEGATRAGVPSLLVLTGVTSAADLIAAEPHHRPTYVARDLRDGLLEPHPPVMDDDRGWTCRDSRVTADGGVQGEGIDLVRAACVAAWSGVLDPERLSRLKDALSA